MFPFRHECSWVVASSKTALPKVNHDPKQLPPKIVSFDYIPLKDTAVTLMTVFLPSKKYDEQNSSFLYGNAPWV